jgi:riboflavin synthase
MFTGIVKKIGKIESIEANAEGIFLKVNAEELAAKANIDDSVCINGVCQTVVSKEGSILGFQAVKVTLEKTNFSDFKIGDLVNLEGSLTPSDPMGGHFVMGHVNGVAEINEVQNFGKNYFTWFKTPPNLQKYIVAEGSVSVDGVSLTIAEVDDASNRFAVSLIPHTWDNTIFHTKNVGSYVNIEVDILAKYIENLLDKREKNLTQKYLKETGF